MTGARKKEHIQSGVNCLFYHMKRIKNTMDKIKDNHDIIDWFIENTKGEFSDHLQDFTIKKPEKFPSFIDAETYDVMMSYTIEYEKYSEYSKRINYFINSKSIYRGELNLIRINEIMLNHNYSLGFEIDRQILNDIINRYGKTSNYKSNFNNMLQPYVKIEIEYTYDTTQGVNRKPNKVGKDTVMVYRTGSITQSGSTMERTKKIYYEFCDIILNNYFEVKICDLPEKKKLRKRTYVLN